MRTYVKESAIISSATFCSVPSQFCLTHLHHCTPKSSGCSFDQAPCPDNPSSQTAYIGFGYNDIRAEFHPKGHLCQMGNPFGLAFSHNDEVVTITIATSIIWIIRRSEGMGRGRVRSAMIGGRYGRNRRRR